MRRTELTAYLDDYLNIAGIPDNQNAFNGLQVEGGAEVARVACAVDACQFTIERALEGGADLLLVHHGLFWGAKAPITGAYYRRLAALLKNDLTLYSAHLPLDVHPEVGNNYVLALALGIEPSGTFGEFERLPLGVYGETEIHREEFVGRVRQALGVEPLLLPTGSEVVRRVGVLTGGGGPYIGSAVEQGVELYLTGEGAHHTYFEAEERGVNVVYAGHYATETVGVRALGDHLARQFGLETFFIDHPTGL